MDDPLVETHHFHSDDPDEVSDFIGRIYADNRFVAQQATRQNVDMAGQEWNGIGIYDVDYHMPFCFRSEEARPNYLFLSCNRGGSTYSSGDSKTVCMPGDVMPISSTGNSNCVTGPEGFGHLSVIIDAQRINDFVGQWIGRELLEPVSFGLEPISQDIATQWDIASGSLRQMMQMAPVPAVAANSLLEHMLKLLVTGHPNNYSNMLDSGHYAREHQARSAIAMIESDPIRWKTLGSVAHAMGYATSALENGIRRFAGKGSAEILYEARLNGVHRALAKESGRSFTTTLRAYGFANSGRFARDYIRRFAEPPAATYQKNPNAEQGPGPSLAECNALCETAINQFIDASLDKPISLADLARLVGKGEHATIAAFREQFSRTPMQYIIERRLERARWLLHHSSASILSIAIECGFGSQSYLTSATKKYFGATPRQIRQSRQFD
ncbi:helix-turn-helix domain-containing protein [Paraburkholderia unamae]|uniref:AraC family transcriptional regulator n=1 Tax=Paraburkholderia unamae TaxID=219649 RepID=A0ABX5KSN7_9BURK|nr:helix-turn-helix domain-containing protein [Paraburkholderia unamae]PVX85638.1 AraC family transcriptional regulator [Paraburkholderia unamae]